eukprot:CAMPEP_0118808180 /NCGR_PEP_ID=MMETSP1161-20130426/35853_1 /TAXON_ID=249345 /ORGANISM="Picochlorum oklahomensis, Strain CCMP2329" /LENGTH=675 /DNA_ID=CAMNT_0006737569 /DNA_START=39 /DNA_END=2063 /DNA_ORIENTATION=-
MLKKKKGKAGNAVQYVTRNQAIKKLQLKISEFRRLCILKGIHPREPKKKVQGAHKTYYHVKDIAFLLHEPLLDKIREIAAHEKKIKRALAKKNRPLAAKISSRRPEYRLDHLVKERYPSLVDALRDLDDPLAMVHLFAVLPADQTKGIPPDRVQLARRLALEWQAYIVASHSLRKSFVSVKGFYYQAEIKGQEITWMVPHQVSQVLPADVDFKVMLTFLEFYQSTLQFVMFSLYNEMGIQYPPNVDDAVDSAGILYIGNTSKMIEEVKSDRDTQAKVKEMSEKITRLEDDVRELDNPSVVAEEESDDEEEQEDDVVILADDDDDDDVPEIDDDDSDSDASDPDVRELDNPSVVAEEESDDEEEQEDDVVILADDDDDLPEIDDDDDDDDSDSDASDPDDEDIPVHKAVSDDEENDNENGPVPAPDVALVGGAVDVADEDGICSTLFKGLKFFLGREVPREQLSLVIQSFGGVVGWDGEGSPYDEMDKRITHHIIDRPKPLIKHENRIFVQPQWVFDSANARVLVNTTKYSPGIVPPPHLSPFIQAEEDDHIPEYAKEIQELKDAAQRFRLKAAGEAVDEEFRGTAQPDAKAEEATLADLEQQREEELAKEIKEATGKDVKTVSGKKRRQPVEEKDDEEAMKDIMMTRKVKKAYQRAMKEKAAKRAKTARLAKKAA